MKSPATLAMRQFKTHGNCPELDVYLAKRLVEVADTQYHRISVLDCIHLVRTAFTAGWIVAKMANTTPHREDNSDANE